MNTRCYFYISILLAGVSFIPELYAQQPNPGLPIGNTREDTIPSGTLPLDTAVDFSYVLLGDPNKVYTSSDTLNWEDIRHYPLPGYYGHLGNYGSASRSFAPVVGSQIGFSTGWNQYDPYYIRQDQFRYYNQEIPVAKVKYSQATQDDTFLTLDFGRRFGDGVSLSVYYNRINQIGQFANQRQKDTGFGVGIWHDAPSGKYDAYYNYTNNSVVAQENGGVSDVSNIGESNFPDMSVPVYLTSATTNHKHRSFLTKQIVHLASDSSDFGIDLSLQASYATGIFKYVDEANELNADYYGTVYLNDERGIRQYTFYEENEWTFGVGLPWRKANSQLNGSLRYRGIHLEQEPDDKNIAELYLEADGVFNWIKPLVLQGGFSLGLGQAQGAFAFNAEADLQIGPLGYVRGAWSLAVRKPALMESSLYVNQTLIYKQDFQNPFMSDFGVSWHIPKQQVEMGVKWIVYDNYIYFDSLSFPQQISGSFSLRRFSLSKSFDFKSLGIRASLFWHPDPREELALPKLWYTASLYGKVRILEQKVTLLPGIDVTYNDGFVGSTYFPVNGQFRLTGQAPIPDYFRIDMGLGLQIRFIKAFVRMEDFVGLFKKRVLYQAEIYPHYRGYLRIGLEASFFN